MLLTVLLAAVSAAPAVSLPLRPMDQPVSVDQRECPNARTYQAADGVSRPRAWRLDELPPGRLELSVLRQVNGCPIPAVVREGIGGNPNGGEGQGAHR